jgi:hypothetical protein
MKNDLVWSAILAAAGAILGFVLLCVAPFSAVAAFAARTLPLRLAWLSVTAMWFVGQVAGFTVFHYPRLPATFALGGAIELAALIAVFVAARIRWIVPAFIAAFANFEAVQYGFALVFGGSETFAPAIVAQLFAGNVLGLVVLWALAAARSATGRAPA